MFRRQTPVILRDTRTEYVTKEVNIHEHRAPTDESVKLLKEMEKAAEEKILQSFKVESNGFKCEVFEVYLDNLSNDVCAWVIFELNGKRIKVKADLPRRKMGMSEIFDAVRDQIAKSIATEILAQEFETLAMGFYNATARMTVG